MHRSGAVAVLLGAVAANAGCAGAWRGGASDRSTHVSLTYVLARAAGHSPRDAVLIAGANEETDFHPDTSSVVTERRLVGGLAHPAVLPMICFSAVAAWAGGEPPVRALAAGTARHTAWTLSPLALKLHFPAATTDAPTRPAFAREGLDALYLLNRDAVAVLDQAFLSLELRDEDVGRSLALLGIGLHVLQDSYKHAGYDGTRGHIGVDPDPDDISRDPALAAEIAESTYLALRHAFRRMHPGVPAPDGGWGVLAESVYGATADRALSVEERWLAALRARFGDPLESWDDLRDRWRAADGPDAFERALVKVRRVVR